MNGASKDFGSVFSEHWKILIAALVGLIAVAVVVNFYFTQQKKADLASLDSWAKFEKKSDVAAVAEFAQNQKGKQGGFWAYLEASQLAEKAGQLAEAARYAQEAQKIAPASAAESFLDLRVCGLKESTELGAAIDCYKSLAQKSSIKTVKLEALTAQVRLTAASDKGAAQALVEQIKTLAPENEAHKRAQLLLDSPQSP